MNRLLSILVALFVLFMLYLWINHITRDPWDPGLEDIPAADVITEDAAPDDAMVDYETSSTSRAEEYAQPDVASPDVEASGKSTEAGAHHVEEKQDTRTPEEIAQAQHLVIAGNFLERSNAEVRARELRNYGFENAEVVNFQLSEYHTVCAGRFRDPQEARRVASKIKDSYNIDAYVRHGN